jgi:hypothetical protein
MGGVVYAWVEHITRMIIGYFADGVLDTSGGLGSVSHPDNSRPPIVALTPIFRYTVGGPGTLLYLGSTTLTATDRAITYCPSERFYSTLEFARSIHLTLPMWAFMTARGIYTTRGPLRLVYQF